MKKALVSALSFIVIAGIIIVGALTSGLTGALLKNYLINTGFTIIKVAIFGVAVWAGFKCVDRFSRIDILEQLSEKSLGAWIWFAAFTIAVALLIGSL